MKVDDPKVVRILLKVHDWLLENRKNPESVIIRAAKLEILIAQGFVTLQDVETIQNEIAKV